MSNQLSEKPVYLTSDVHLGAVSKETEAAFLRWLAHVEEHASALIVNGDLFEFWYEYRKVLPRGYIRTLGGLARLVDAGMPVTLMGGNHDWWGGEILKSELGVTFYHDPVKLEVAGRRVLLAHGDGLGGGDPGYQILKKVLRSRLTQWAFRWLHPDIGGAIACKISRTADFDGERSVAQKARAERLRHWATAQLAEDPSLDLVVLGHTHFPELHEVAEGKYYLNAGDWLGHRSYAVLSPGRPPELKAWEVQQSE